MGFKYWGSPAMEQVSDGFCSYYKGKHSTFCATFKKSSNDTDAAVVCLLYTRPKGGKDGAEMCEDRILQGVPSRHGPTNNTEVCATLLLLLM
jgi:hypothetical protein